IRPAAVRANRASRIFHDFPRTHAPRGYEEEEHFTIPAAPAFPGRHGPDLDLALAAVAAGHRQEAAVRTKRHAADRAGLAEQVQESLARRGVPELDRLVLARRGQQPAVGAEGDAVDLVGMAVQGPHFPAG